MVTRNGEPAEHTVSGYAGRLTRSELEAYNAAFRAIRTELRELEKLQEQLDRLERKAWDDLPDMRRFVSLETDDGGRWEACGFLLRPSRSEVLFCRQAEGTRWAVIQRFQPESPYAQAHGSTEVLLTGNNARELAMEYAAQAQHTLRFMASNLVARAQKIVWDQYSHTNPDRVMRSLSERCGHAVKNTEVVRQAQSITETVTEPIRRSHSIRV